MKGYLITEEQLEKLEDFERMLDVNAEIIAVLCSEEKDDIVYGFELGKVHSDLRQCYIDMMNLKSEIRAYQTFNTEKK
jgi:hypothetical protein